METVVRNCELAHILDFVPLGCWLNLGGITISCSQSIIARGSGEHSNNEFDAFQIKKEASVLYESLTIGLRE